MTSPPHEWRNIPIFTKRSVRPNLLSINFLFHKTNVIFDTDLTGHKLLLMKEDFFVQKKDFFNSNTFDLILGMIDKGKIFNGPHNTGLYLKKSLYN